ncbi:MAG TPA: electron transfer flavoprotein subunit alpha/FixB family protein, partial [Gammaproteobacteria bacterium]|nr:electron transfer flavoprotein subunit alpha/FixB family protein [Gammaproteobacteria bacterium]
MSVLVLAEHNNADFAPATLNTITAAAELSADVHVLVAGSNCKPVAEALSKVKGVSRVRVSDDSRYEHPLAEPLAALLVSLA